MTTLLHANCATVLGRPINASLNTAFGSQLKYIICLSQDSMIARNRAGPSSSFRLNHREPERLQADLSRLIGTVSAHNGHLGEGPAASARPPN